MTFGKFISLWNLYPNQDTVTFLSLHTVPLCSFVVTLPYLPKATSDLTPSLQICCRISYKWNQVVCTPMSSFFHSP